MALTLLLPFVGSAKSDTTNERITLRLQELLTTPPIPQSQLDSLSERLIHLNNLIGTPRDGACQEMALLKAEIAHGIMNGGRSIHIVSILEDNLSCTPHHGLYNFFLGGIAYSTGQFEISVDKYRSALEALGIEDRASVLIQLNLSAALEGAGRQAEAIDSLNAILNGEHWQVAPAIEEGLYNTQITVNAAAILISEKRYTEALNLLTKLEASNISEYWRIIKQSNEYIAMSMLARFHACDSLWTSNLKYIPISRLPLPLFEYTLGSWLATDAFGYVEQLLREPNVSSQLLENEESTLSALLAPQLSDSARKQLWDILVTANRLERGRMKDLAASREKNGTESALFAGLEEKIGLQKKTVVRWQLTAIVLLLVLLGYALIRFYFKRQSEIEIRMAIKQAQLSQQNALTSVIKITKSDIRKIHLGLTKGYQIGEALLSLQKVEAVHKYKTTAPEEKALHSIKGIKDLSKSEFSILKLSLEEFSTKEIAHQLQVGSGYVYNSRSTIRKKLNIPKESSLEDWVQQQTTLQEGPSE
jgi:DNA-binding CsgD family transcriptional regulator